ncbi:hypothetical protein QTV49_001838 [Vibrio vulnificus]|nr:hypothetical protein [Vibrio vulnificus]
MYVRLKKRVVKEVEFSVSDENVYEFNGVLYSDVNDLLTDLGDEELAYSFLEVFLSYLNRNRSSYKINTSDLSSVDGYDIQWGLEMVYRETGLKVSYFGVVYSLEFDGFTEGIPDEGHEQREYVLIPSVAVLNAQD